MKKLSIKFQISPEEFITAYRLHFNHGGRFIIYVSLSGILLIIGLVLCFLYGYSFINAAPVYCSALLSVLLLFVYFREPYLVFSLNPRITDEQIFTLQADYLNLQIPDAKVNLRWKFYDRFIEDENFYLLYYGKEIFHIIPRRALSEEDQKVLSSLLPVAIPNLFNKPK